MSQRKGGELNPNHGVTQEMREQWYKLCAILMMKFGVDTVDVTSADIEAFSNSGKANIAMQPRRDKITLTLVTDAEAVRLSREAGGLPV